MNRMMQLTIVLESRFVRAADGTVWTQHTGEYSFWERYLVVFDRVLVVARVRDVRDAPKGYMLASGVGVEFAALENYTGLVGFVLAIPGIIGLALRVASEPNTFLVRAPSTIGIAMCPVLKLRKQPFFLEVVGDSADVFAPNVIRHPLRPLLRAVSAFALRRMCSWAQGVSYVTERYLQERYPCREYSVGVSDVDVDAGDEDRILAPFNSWYSSIELDVRDDAESPVHADVSGRQMRIVTVASLSQDYKGIGVLIRAVAKCHAHGRRHQVVIIGDGIYRSDFERLAVAEGVRDSVEFTGYISSRRELWKKLDASDLFVLPSLTEGLPRALVEAMARGLPCIASRVGGIPELLAGEDLFEANSVDSLFGKLDELSGDCRRIAKMRQRNLARSREFGSEVLRARRLAFYRHVKRSAEAIAGRTSRCGYFTS